MIKAKCRGYEGFLIRLEANNAEATDARGFIINKIISYDIEILVGKGAEVRLSGVWPQELEVYADA